MKKHLLWALALGICFNASAQDRSAKKYAKQISAKYAKKHLSVLASDEYEGRETGKAGAEKAANYIAAEFKKLGLTAPVNGSYLQQVNLVQGSVDAKNFTVNNLPLTYGKDYYFSGTPDSKTINATELVFIGYGIDSESYSDLKNTDISGKLVMVINNGEPTKNGISAITKTAQPSDWTTGRNKRMRYILGKNPLAILAVNPEVSGMLEKNGAMFTSSNGRLALKADKPSAAGKGAPVINIGTAAANQFLKGSGKTYEGLKDAIDNQSTPQTQTLKTNVMASFGPKNTDVNSSNVLGFIEGTDLKDEILVISAHYDHVGLTTSGADKVNNGADDDGSGTTGVMALARAYAKAKKAGKGPRRSILFLAVTGEEKGLLGSEWYSENPVFPLGNTVANLNIDMIGRIGTAYKGNIDSANYCYLIGSDKLSTDLHRISEEANAKYTKMKTDYKFNDPKDPERIYYRSDHYNFAKHGIPIIFYFNGVHEDYHKPSDEVSKINFPLLAKRAQLVYYTSWELANRDKRPVVDVKNDMPASR